MSQEKAAIILIALIFIGSMVFEVGSILIDKYLKRMEENQFSDYEQIEKPVLEPKEKILRDCVHT